LIRKILNMLICQGLPRFYNLVQVRFCGEKEELSAM